MKSLFYISCFLFLAACTPSHMTTYTKDGLFSIEAPDFLKEVDHLNPDASLQLANNSNDFLTMVIVDSKEQFMNLLEQQELQNDFPNNLDGITLFLQNLHHNIEASGGKINHRSEIKKIMVHGKDAREYTMEVTIEGENLYYLYTIIEGDAQYYQIMSWTYTSLKDSYQKDFEHINHSLKEL